MAKVYKSQYERYVAQFERTKKHLIKRGFYKDVTDVQMMNREEFEWQIELFREKRTGKASGYTNVIRQLATSKFYARTIEQAENLRDTLQGLGVETVDGKPLTIENLRVFGLADLNEALKKKGIASSYARARYISYYVYDSE